MGGEIHGVRLSMMSELGEAKGGGKVNKYRRRKEKQNELY